MKSHQALLRTAFVCGLLASGFAHAAAFQNGSFENGTLNSTSTFDTLGLNSTAMSGWTVTDGNIDYIGGLWQAADGGRSVDLAGDKLGTISQTFDTISGQIYKVVFAMAVNPHGGPLPRTLNVTADNETGNYSFNTSGTSTSDMGWIDQLFSFTADGAQTTLSFTATNGECCTGPALDNVRVSVVPEPASLGLLGLGLAGLGAFRRKRKAD